MQRHYAPASSSWGSDPRPALAFNKDAGGIACGHLCSLLSLLLTRAGAQVVAAAALVACLPLLFAQPPEYGYARLPWLVMPCDRVSAGAGLAGQ